MSPTTTTGWGEASRWVLTKRKVRPRWVRSTVDQPRSTRTFRPRRFSEKDDASEKLNDRTFDTEMCFSASVRTRIRSWSVKRAASVGEIGMAIGIVALLKFEFVATTV